MTIPWLFHDYSIAIPWPFHGYPMAILWPFHDYSMAIPWLIQWLCHDISMTISWQFQNYSMIISWLFHDYSMTMTIPWLIHIPWWFHGDSMTIPWQSHDDSMTMIMPWPFHDHAITPKQFHHRNNFWTISVPKHFPNILHFHHAFFFHSTEARGGHWPRCCGLGWSPWPGLPVCTAVLPCLPLHDACIVWRRRNEQTQKQSQAQVALSKAHTQASVSEKAASD
jgi:hypothetical protein